jgi:hypothetical protein
MGSRRWLLAAAALVPLAVSGSAQSAQQAVTHPVLQQTAADCKTIGDGVVVLGQACADERHLVDPDTWTVDPRSAHWAESDFASAYEWDLPDTVPAAGAPLTLKVATAEITRTPAGKACAHIEASGGFTFRSGTTPVAQPTLEVCTVNGASDAKNMTVTLVPPKADTALLRIAVQSGPTLTYRYGTREGRFTFTAAKPKLKARGDTATVTVTAGPVRARFAVLAEHVRGKTASASLELTAIAPRSGARGCAVGAVVSLKLIDDGRRDAARLTAPGRCAFLGGAFSNGVAGSAKVAISG